VQFLRQAVAHYSALGVRIERLLTDTGSAYRSKVFARACQALGIKHTFTRPYRPQTKGKDESGLGTIECPPFLNPKVVPVMADAKQALAGIRRIGNSAPPFFFLDA